MHSGLYTIRFKFFHLLLVILFSSTTLAQTKDSLKSKYTCVPVGYLMVLKQGDNLFNYLEAIAKAENIPSANFTGMGFAEVEFGYFDSKTKKYKSKKFRAGELASMQGTLAWQNEKPSIHVHGLITNKKFNAYGGHILSANVGTGTLEVLIILHDKKLQRIKDEKLGANVLSLNACHE